MSYIKNFKNAQKNEAGFTLIELSIVLVIIGLIVGGILTGQDLIKAAEQRATIAQIEKYNTAVNTFRNKYNCIPGDCPVSVASSFGLFTLTNGTAGQGDGNGLIEGQSSGGIILNGEVVVFFRHLSDASLVDGSFAATGAATGTIAVTGLLGATTAASGMQSLLPLAKLGRGNHIIPMAYQGVNYFVMTGMGGASITTAGVVTGETNNMTPLESLNIDKKVDDGLPGTGSVFAIDGLGQISTAGTINTLSATNCVASAAYQVTTTYVNSLLCSLRFRFN